MPVSHRQRKLNKSKYIEVKNKPVRTIKQTHLKTDYGNPVQDESVMFYPPVISAFKAIFCSRILSAIWLHVTDCDETYNYWEPSHYLLFDTGFQTWEYSPQYALRSYFYLLIHIVPAWLYYVTLHPNRLLLFYFIRCFLALFCTMSEVFFYKSVCREFGVNIGRLTLAILIFSPGMFIASTAFLPSSFSMYMTFLFLTAWFYRKYSLSIFLTAISALISWPFSALIGLPIAYDMVFIQKRWRSFIKWSCVSAFAILIPLIEIDSSYYGKLTFAPWNIIKYNIFTAHGPDLYGTEPWFYYILNGFLNFNIAFIIALATPFLLIWIKLALPKKPRNPECLSYFLSLGSLYLWLLIFCLQAHKEERFLFPVYPLIALSSAVGIDAIQVLSFRYFIKKGFHYAECTMKIALVILFCYFAFGISRMLALYKGYHAPMDVFIELTKIDASSSGKLKPNVCIGKEWHRFPSSFFIPNNWRIDFIKSEFKGQLPSHYLNTVDAAKVVRADMNDRNEEESSRYIKIDACNYLVDMDSDTPTGLEPVYSKHPNWTSIFTLPFLNKEKTSTLVRSFYIPFVWEYYSSFLSYHLLERVQKPNSTD